MNETEIKQQLDLLDEFHAQKDALELRKRELLDDVKIPAEIEALVSDGMRRVVEVDAEILATANAGRENLNAELAAAVVPDELKDALAEVERQRAAIVVPDELKAVLAGIERMRADVIARIVAHDRLIAEAITDRKKELQEEIQAQTRDVYAQVARRKQEIEIEFSGKANDADENIKKLEAEIKDAVKKYAAEKLEANPKCKDLSIKGTYYHAVYVKARKTWIPAKLDDYTENHPDIKNCFTLGDPSITIRPI